MLFDGDGLGTRHEVVQRMELNDLKPFVKSPVETKELRLEHMCEWEDHELHDDENDVFYAPILAYVTDRGRLNIFHKFVKSHEMWKFHNALLKYKAKEFYVDLDVESHSDRPNSKNHVTMKYRWKDIVAKCGWEKNKMVRFKLVEQIPDVKASVHGCKPVMIPVFHMC
ncbi:hypothetical protein CTI12_AA275330 [Artemisia annua]|uniref:Uncharacterized protein n=1 Tax=Artemisia annua TaxID=35608 RepID=A0A2U1NF59_ARTAN|nr:hypothetical protein CTI12_AA275330 [Artemisia annua]